MPEPLYTLDQVADQLGIPVDQLQAFLDKEMPGMVAEGAAHWDDRLGGYVITGTPED